MTLSASELTGSRGADSGREPDSSPSHFVTVLAQCFDGNEAAAAKALKAFGEVVAEVVARGEKVQITGFGTFEPTIRPARTEPGPEVSDAELAVLQSAGKGRGAAQGFKLTVAEKLAIENHAVAAVTEELVMQGYVVKDVGNTESFDLDARKGSNRLWVEVKGTTSSGSQILLTSDEVKLHLKKFPDNALGIVHSINLDKTADPPQASRGSPRAQAAMAAGRGPPYAVCLGDIAPNGSRHRCCRTHNRLCACQTVASARGAMAG